MPLLSAPRRYMRHLSDTATLGLVLAIISAADWLTDATDPEHVGLLDDAANTWRRWCGVALALLVTAVACATLTACGGGADDIVGPPPPATIQPVHCVASGVCQ